MSKSNSVVVFIVALVMLPFSAQARLRDCRLTVNPLTTENAMDSIQKRYLPGAKDQQSRQKWEQNLKDLRRAKDLSGDFFDAQNPNFASAPEAVSGECTEGAKGDLGEATTLYSKVGLQATAQCWCRDVKTGMLDQSGTGLLDQGKGTKGLLDQ